MSTPSEEKIEDLCVMRCGEKKKSKKKREERKETETERGRKEGKGTVYQREDVYTALI